VSGNLPIFDGKCYSDWCVKMDTILGFQDVDEIVQKGCKEPRTIEECRGGERKEETRLQSKNANTSVRVCQHFSEDL